MKLSMDTAPPLRALLPLNVASLIVVTVPSMFKALPLLLRPPTPSAVLLVNSTCVPMSQNSGQQSHEASKAAAAFLGATVAPRPRTPSCPRLVTVHPMVPAGYQAFSLLS